MNSLLDTSVSVWDIAFQMFDLFYLSQVSILGSSIQVNPFSIRVLGLSVLVFLCLACYTLLFLGGNSIISIYCKRQ